MIEDGKHDKINLKRTEKDPHSPIRVKASGRAVRIPAKKACITPLAFKQKPVIE